MSKRSIDAITDAHVNVNVNNSPAKKPRVGEEEVEVSPVVVHTPSPVPAPVLDPKLHVFYYYADPDDSDMLDDENINAYYTFDVNSTPDAGKLVAILKTLGSQGYKTLVIALSLLAAGRHPKEFKFGDTIYNTLFPTYYYTYFFDDIESEEFDFDAFNALFAEVGAIGTWRKYVTAGDGDVEFNNCVAFNSFYGCA